MVHILFEMPEEGSGTRMGAEVLAHDVSPSVLSVVPARGPDHGTAHHRPAVLGRSVRRDRDGRSAGRATVQHRRSGGFRVPGWMGVSHAHVACARRHATGRHVLPEPRSHPNRWPLQGVCVDLKVKSFIWLW